MKTIEIQKELSIIDIIDSIFFRVMHIKCFVISFLIFSFLSVYRVSATPQIPERLVIDGETFIMQAWPLYKYPVIFTHDMLFDEYSCVSTGCYRGYVATWSIENDSLFLIKIGNDCCADEHKLAMKEAGLDGADLSLLFPEKYRNGKVFAEWVTQDLLAISDKYGLCLDYFEIYSYDKEIEYIIKNGIVQEIRNYDNSNSKKSSFNKTFIDDVYNRIDWEQIPELNDKKIRISMTFSANEDGFVDSVRIYRSDNDDDLYKQATLNAILNMGGFGVYYKKGEVQRLVHDITIVFSSENREKYGQKNFLP